MSEMAIQVKDLSKVYKLYNKPSDRLKETLGFHVDAREHYALKHVNFEIRKGETVGIIGTNGSGKSTILKIITGVLNPTGGEVNVDGRISALLELGAGFNMEYTGIENVYLNGTMLGFTKEEIDERLDNILEFADIGDFVNQPVKSYSSGMFVRLAFAVAINIDPEILIVDEALSVGDVFFQAKCYRKFEDFKKEGKTILFVSHDLGSITKYCSRVRAWTAMSSAPACSQALAHSTAVMWSASQPFRILTVTGRVVWALTCSTMRPQRSGSSISLLPAPPETIFGAGQPMLMSRKSN